MHSLKSTEGSQLCEEGASLCPTCERWCEDPRHDATAPFPRMPAGRAQPHSFSCAGSPRSRAISRNCGPCGKDRNARPRWTRHSHCSSEMAELKNRTACFGRGLRPHSPQMRTRSNSAAGRSASSPAIWERWLTAATVRASKHDSISNSAQSCTRCHWVALSRTRSGSQKTSRLSRRLQACNAEGSTLCIADVTSARMF